MQMQFDPALLMENCTPAVHLDVIQDLEVEKAASMQWERLAEGQLAEEHLAAQLLILEESASNSAITPTTATPLDLVEHTHTQACYRRDLLQASTFHPNRCTIL